MEDKRKYFQPITPVNDNLLCKICDKIALNAQECVHCESLFCEECVQKRKIKKNKCPEESCEGEFLTKQPHRLVKFELSQIEFQCINRGEGCQEALKINDVLQHANVCQFALQTCNCGWRGKKSLLKDHEKNCPLLATQMCPTCKESILQSKFMKHNCIQDLKENLEKISEKFFDYKESSEFAIKDLKNQFSHQILEIQDLKHLQQVMIAEQSELKNALQKLFAIYQEQEKKLKEVSEQDKIPECNLREAFTLKCANNHDLYYWFNPKGENRKKKCVKCQKNDVNIRYYCPICKIFLCLVCEQPEIVTRQNQSHCPARHPITRKNELPQNCSVCERSASSMLQPGGFSCGTCDFAICMSCIEAKRFNNKPQDCPVQ